MPQKPWNVQMIWHDLLFMHWQVPQGVVRGLVPAALEIDRFDGRAWIGVIPFRMSGVRPRLVPPFLASKFPETNVRTYVRYKGRPGVWFFSLDAADRLAVWSARRFFHLPYYFASMSVSTVQEMVDYRTHRAATPEIHLSCRYRPVGAPFSTTDGTIEHWLTERYCLFAANRRRDIFRGDIHHARWLLQVAEAEIEANSMTFPLGITLPDDRPLLHFAKRQDVLAWPLVSEEQISSPK